MANWNNPTLATLYPAFLQELKDRDTDALTLAPGTNLPVNAKRWDGASNTFQNWDGLAWNTLVLGVAGGGTGATTVAGIRTALGLGTMSTQNSNAVAITGGTITGVALNAGDITAGVVALARGGTGASLVAASPGFFLQMNPAGTLVTFGVNGGLLQGLNASNIAAGNIPMANMPVGGTWTLTGAVEIQAASYIRILSSSGFVVGPIGNTGAGTINATGYFLNGVPLSVGSTLPSGLMAIFLNACPPGWTRVNAADGRFVRFTAAGGGAIGGADTHQHSVVGPITGQSTTLTDVRSMTGSNRSYDAGGSFSGFQPDNSFSHQHQFPHSHDINLPTDFVSNVPSFIEYVLCMNP